MTMPDAARQLFTSVHRFFFLLSEILLGFVEYYEGKLVRLTFLLLEFTSPSRMLENRQRMSYYVFCLTLLAFIGIIALDSDNPFKKEENLKTILSTVSYEVPVVRLTAFVQDRPENLLIPSACSAVLFNKAPPSILL